MAEWSENAQASSNQEMRNSDPSDPTATCKPKEWELVIEVEEGPEWESKVDVNGEQVPPEDDEAAALSDAESAELAESEAADEAAEAADEESGEAAEAEASEADSGGGEAPEAESSSSIS